MKYIITILFLFLISAQCLANEYYLECENVGDNIKRCENEEVICYIYDSGWAGIMRSGRGAGISCIKKEKQMSENEE